MGVIKIDVTKSPLETCYIDELNMLSSLKMEVEGIRLEIGTEWFLRSSLQINLGVS